MGDRKTSADVRLAHVRRWQSSGLTRAEYCAEHGLNLHTFDSWRRQAKDGVTWVPITVREGSASAQPATGAGASIRVFCRNDVRLELSPEVASSWLVDLLRGLGAC